MDMSEETFAPGEALATFNHAAEEIRFFKGQQWHLTNYALIAFAALAAAPDWVERASWKSYAPWVAILLIGLAGAVAALELGRLERALNKERLRLHAARDHLLLIRDIHRRYPSEDGLEMLKLWKTPYMFVAVMTFGAWIAVLINVSRIF
jgi:hypothetical protein